MLRGMERAIILSGLALCVFALWALVRHDRVRWTTPSRRVTARVCGHEARWFEDTRSYATRYRFTAEGAEHEVVDAVFTPTRSLAEGTSVELAYPAGRPDLARPRRAVLWPAVYGLLLVMIVLLAARL